MILSSRLRPLVVVVVLCPTLTAQTFKSTVDHVAIPVTVQSDATEPVLNLQPGDFRVFDDGRAVPIVAVGRITPPLHVLLLLDTSRSMMQSLSEVTAAAEAVIKQLAPDDSFQIGTFSNSLRISPVFSADDRHVGTRLSLVPGAHMTTLYDALVEGCDVFTGEKRRAIFVVSDGTDTASSASARAVMQRAAEMNVSIHAVGVAGRAPARGKPVSRAPDPVLREIAEDSGGAYVNAGSGRDFSQLFAHMIEELRREYMLGFTPARADGRLHSVVVTTRRANVKVRARKQYLSPLP